ncbi:MAG: TRAP transporter small permease [Hyphomicrobiales bacterium]
MFGPLKQDVYDVIKEAGPEGVFGIFCISLILVTMSLGVLFRYVFNDSLSWTEEFSRYGLIYATFIGSAYACRRGSHIRVSFIDEILPPKLRHWLGIFQDLVTLGLVCYLAVLAVQISGILHATRSAAMLIPMSFIYAAVIAGFTLSAFRLVIRLYRKLGV